MNLNAIKNRIRAIRRNSQISKAHLPVMQFDPNYSMGLVDQGFQARGSRDIDDSMLARIVDAYNLAKSQQKEAGAEYQVSNEWVPIFKAQFGSAIDALARRDLAQVRQIYSNFFRDPVSTGLHGMPVNMKKTYFSGSVTSRAKRAYLVDALYRYNYWRNLLPLDDANVLVRPDIGNPYGITFDGLFITPGAEYQHFYAKKVLSLVKPERPTVLELGGGYGGFAYYINQLGYQARYIGIDLPEVLALATFYLMAAFPEKRFVLFGEMHNSEEIHDADFVMWPNFMLKSVSAGDVDIIFNSYSLGEMSPKTIQTYVAEFGRIGAPWLVHVNHVFHAVLGADSFGIEAVGYDLHDRRKALWNLGRQLDMDEHEFVYRRRQTAN